MKVAEKKAEIRAEKRSDTVPLDWKEVYYTNCPMVSASNIDQELGWAREEFKKIGIKYGFLRSRRENNWYPHYVHNLDNLIRFGGLFPPIHVQADIRRTRLLGLTWVHEGGCLMVQNGFRARNISGGMLSRAMLGRSKDRSRPAPPEPVALETAGKR